MKDDVNENEKDKKKRKWLLLLLLLLFFLIVCTSISVIIFNTGFKIRDFLPNWDIGNDDNSNGNNGNNGNNNSNSNNNSTKWSIGFVTGEYKEIDGKSFCGDMIAKSTTISLNEINFSKNNTVCKYRLTIKNKGNVDAQLSSITLISPDMIPCEKKASSMICNNVTYILSKDLYGDNELNIGEEVKKQNGMLDLYFIVRSDFVSDASYDIQSNAGFTLFFTQSNN